ncbi:MAG TPA: RseA family anti-sigma factor [Ktedonobacteraceae bacterium]|nr:RseA family anti-sigma factor [Ktedonobacteraceae bacterium]
MLSAYRELKNEEIDTTELDAHLETCKACREALASYTMIGEKMRSTTVFTPPADMHEKLMKALADEQLKFLQKSAPGKTATPEFLKPYLQERAKEAQAEDDIAAFSTAETGPLPILPARRKRRKVKLNQFAVLGLAASILIMLMMGGLTSLLMIARSNPNSISRNSVSLARQAEVNQKTYVANTLYPNISSAIPTRDFVYYAASGQDDNSNSWMLMQFNRNTKISKPLLAVGSNEPLVVIAASDTWLIWLEYDRAQSTPFSSMPEFDNHHSPERSWSLYYLSLLPPTQSTSGSIPSTHVTPTGNDGQQDQAQQGQSVQVDVPTPVLLTRGVFDKNTAPGWVTGPLQGTWLMGDTLLVAQIDQKGTSYLKSYLLGETGKNARGVVIAKASGGHVLTWPTANNTGTSLYWGEEWVSESGVLHGNIWQRQESVESTGFHGYVKNMVSHTQKVLLNDGLSFQPQVVNDTLFFMSTSEVRISSQERMEPNGIPLPNSVIDPSVTFTARTDQRIYPALADASLHGTIFALPFDGPRVGNETILGTVGQSTSFQAGNSYIVWKDNRGYNMYDLNRQSEVAMGDTLADASLLVVSGTTTLWLDNNQAANKLTFMAYNWPN